MFLEKLKSFFQKDFGFFILILIAIVFIIFLLWSAKFVFASDFNTPAGEGYGSALGCQYYSWKLIRSPETYTSGIYITQAKFQNYSNADLTSGFEVRAKIFKGGSGLAFNSDDLLGVSNTLGYSDMVVGWNYFTFSPAVYIPPNTDIWIKFETFGGGCFWSSVVSPLSVSSAITTSGFSNTSSGINKALKCSGGNGGIYGSSEISDITSLSWDSLKTSYTQTSACQMTFGYTYQLTNPDEAITFTNPTNNSTTTPDLGHDNWKVDFSLGSGRSIKIKIEYGLATSTLDYSDEYLAGSYATGGAYSAVITRSRTLYSGAFTSFNWFARASLIDTSDNSVISTHDIAFVVSPIGWSTILEPPITTTTTPNLTMTCDPDSGFFQYSLCYLMTYLFIPSQQSVEQFSNLLPEIQNKPPLGYFYSMKTALSGLSTSTAPFSINTGNSGETTSPFYIFRTGLSWLFWFIFGFWIFNRFRHLEI